MGPRLLPPTPAGGSIVHRFSRPNIPGATALVDHINATVVEIFVRDRNGAKGDTRCRRACKSDLQCPWFAVDGACGPRHALAVRRVRTPLVEVRADSHV